MVQCQACHDWAPGHQEPLVATQVVHPDRPSCDSKVVPSASAELVVVAVAAGDDPGEVAAVAVLVDLVDSS